MKAAMRMAAFFIVVSQRKLRDFVNIYIPM